MSFHFQFAARSKRAALNQLGTLSMPDSVRSFITQALEAMEGRHAVYISATGHLYSQGDYQVSTADIKVVPMEYIAEPPEQPDDAVPEQG